MKGIKLGNKESKYPIIQGGMGVGVWLHRLAGNVSKEGGIGVNIRCKCYGSVTKLCWNIKRIKIKEN